MALFNKKSAYERLLEDFNALPDEDKAKFRTEIADVKKAEDEREIGKIEEEKADTKQETDEKEAEVKEETEEIGKEVYEAEKTANEDENVEAKTMPDVEKKTESETEAEQEAEDEKDDALETKFNSFLDKYEKMEERLERLEARFEDSDEATTEGIGLGKQKIVDTGKDEGEMSAAEIAKKYAKF